MIAIVAALASLGVLSQTSQAQPGPWKPVPGHIMTRWAADVSPEKAWPEYPRPQFARDQWQSLNGLWDYTLVGPKGESTGKILVPFPIESALSGVAKPLDPAGSLTYKRSFKLPKEWAGQRLILHFGAVDWKATVTLNGKSIGTHTGGYDPFSFEVTGAILPEENQLAVEVTDPTDRAGQPIGKQRLKPESIWYTPTSGIWQTVWIEPIPRESISRIDVKADLATSKVHFKLDLANDVGAKDSRACTIEISEGGRTIATAHGDPSEPITVEVPSARHWEPDAPTLYDAKVTLSSGDSVRTYFAFRDVAIAKDDAGINRITLNQKPIFQYGPLDQGFWPDGLYTPPTDEAMKEDILAVKKMHGNMLRKHVKVEPDRFYYWCDKLGVLVWQDMPSPFPPKEGAGDWKKTFEDELSRMIGALKAHPSIIMWVPFNEGWGQHDTQEIVAKVQQWDPTRLVNNASGWTDMKVGSTTDLHAYPGPAMPAVDPGRACVLGEFGGLGLPLEGHTWTSKANWGYVSFKDQKELTGAYVSLVEQLPPLIAQGLCAAVYTQTTDVEIECNGWMTYDRAVWKIDPDQAAAATQKLFGPPPRITTILACAQQGPQTWRYTLDQPDEGWSNGAFEDDSWKSGPSGFGKDGTPGAIIGTAWTSDDIWLRRAFDLAEAPKNPYLWIHHDEDAEVFINGMPVANLKNYTTGYKLEPIPADALQKGRNTIAVHCRQTRGGQYIDAGVVDLTPR